MSVTHYLTHATGKLAYQQQAGKLPGIVFCCGFMSDMTGNKAEYLAKLCQQQGRAFVRFDYSGHGQSTGNIIEANISQWLQDTLAVLKHLTTGPQIIVGSSMGAWLALLTAKIQPVSIKAIITLAAAAVDFTEDLIWLKLTQDMQTRLLQNEALSFPSPYSDKPCVITRQFVDDGRQHLLLRSPLALNCSVHLMHGMQDPDVPWQTSLQLLEKLQVQKAKLTLIKDGDHRLAREEDLLLLGRIVDSYCD